MRASQNWVGAGGSTIVTARFWLRESALDEYQLSRTTLYLADGVIAGYYSLASSTVELSQRYREQNLALVTRRGTLPATLVTWLAKDHRAGFDAMLLIKHATALARRAMLAQASAALVLDPYDEATAELWAARHVFRRSSANSRRLWIALAPED